MSSRNKEFDKIFLRGSFDNGLIDGTAFAAQQQRPGYDPSGYGSVNPSHGASLEMGGSRLAQRQFYELQELQARQSEQRAHLVVLGQPPRTDALRGYQCVDLVDPQIVDLEDRGRRQLCFSRDGVARSAHGSKATSTTVYQNGKQVVQLHSGGASEKLGGVAAGHRQPRQSHQTSLNQTNSHSQIISPHFYRQEAPHGTEEELLGGGGGAPGRSVDGVQAHDQRASAHDRGTGSDQNLDLKSLGQQHSEVGEQTFQPHGQPRGPSDGRQGQGPSAARINAAEDDALNSAQLAGLSAHPHDLAHQQALAEMLMVQQMHKAAELQSKRNQYAGGQAARTQQNLQQSSVHSAAKSAAHHEAVQYLEQLSSVSGKVASAQVEALLVEAEDQLGVQGVRVRNEKKTGSLHGSKESKMTSKSQTHSQIMKMMKTMEEFGRNMQLAGGDAGPPPLPATELLLAQLSSGRSKSNELSAVAHLLPTRQDDAAGLGSASKYPSTRRAAIPLGLRIEDQENMQDDCQEVTFASVSAERRAMQIFNSLIGLVLEQAQTKSPKISFIYGSGPLGTASARYASVSSKNTGRTAPFQRVEARSERKRSTLSSDVKSQAHQISGCVGCQEILLNKRQLHEAKALLNLPRAMAFDDLYMSRGFQRLQGFLAEPDALTPKAREKKELILCKKIEETIEALQKESGPGLTDEQLLARILGNFETLGEQRVATNPWQRSAQLGELQKSQKYKIVKGQIFEAVQVKEHQFRQQINQAPLASLQRGQRTSAGSAVAGTVEAQFDSDGRAIPPSARSNGQASASGSRSRSRTHSKSPAAGRASSSLKYDRYGNRADGSQGRESSRLFGVGFGCDITYKSKEKVLYQLSGRVGRAEAALGGAGYTTLHSGGAGLGSFHTIEEVRKGTAKHLTASSPAHYLSKPRYPEQSVYKDTQIGTQYHTAHESRQSPAKSPRLDEQRQDDLGRHRGRPQSTAQDLDQFLIPPGGRNLQRPMTCKMPGAAANRQTRTTGVTSEAQPSFGQVDDQPRQFLRGALRALGQGYREGQRSSFVTDTWERSRVVASNNPYGSTSSVQPTKFRPQPKSKLNGQTQAPLDQQSDVPRYRTRRAEVVKITTSAELAAPASATSTLRQKHGRNQQSHQSRRNSRSNQVSAKSKAQSSRQGRKQAGEGLQQAVAGLQKPSDRQRTAQAFSSTVGGALRQPTKDLQILSAIGMMGGFRMPPVAVKNQLNATVGLAELDKERRNPFQLALGVTGKQAGRHSASQAGKIRQNTAPSGRSHGPNNVGSSGGLDKSRRANQLRLEQLGTLKKEKEEEEGGADNDSRDYEEVTEVTGPAGGETSAPIHFRDELGPTRRRSGHQQQLMLQKATHSRRRLLSKQGQGGTAAVSYAQFSTAGDNELNPQFRVEFRKSNQRFVPGPERGWLAGADRGGRAGASSSGLQMYEGLQEVSSDVAHNNLGAASMNTGSVPEDVLAGQRLPDGEPGTAAASPADALGGLAGQKGARGSPAGRKGTEDIELDTKEDLEDAQHTEQKNMKSSSARHTNESPYQVESKSSLRRQISLTKNLRKDKDEKKAPNSNEDPDELDLMNEDDFVRAPLNLDMEISQDAIETHHLELSKDQLQGKASSSMGQSKQGHSKSRAKNSSELAASQPPRSLLPRDGLREPASLLHEPASAGERSHHSQEQMQLLEPRTGVQASAHAAAWQQLTAQPGRRPVAQEHGKRAKPNGSDSLDRPGSLKTPPTVHAAGSRAQAEYPSNSGYWRAPHAQQQVQANRNTGGQVRRQQEQRDEAEWLPRTAEWSPMRAGAEARSGRPGVGATRAGQAAGADAGTGALANWAEQRNGTAAAGPGVTQDTMRRPQEPGARQRSSGQQVDMATYEDHLDMSGAAAAVVGDQRENERNGGGAGTALAQAQIVKNVVLFSKSPHQSTGLSPPTQSGVQQEGQRARVGTAFQRSQGAVVDGIGGQEGGGSLQPRPLGHFVVQQAARGRQEKSLLDLIKPNTAIISSKSQGGALGAARAFTRTQKLQLGRQSRTKPVALTSAAGLDRSVKSSAAGPVNPIPGSHLSEAGRLLKSYKTSCKSRKIRMAESLHQSRQPQYNEGVNIKLSLKEGAAPPNKREARAEVHNQQSYLRSEQVQKHHTKRPKIGEAAQLDRYGLQRDQDALDGYYEPYSIVIRGDGGEDALQMGGELEDTEMLVHGEESLQRGPSSAGAQPERSATQETTHHGQPYAQARTEEQPSMLQQQLNITEALPDRAGGPSPPSDIRPMSQGQLEPADAEPQAYHVQSVVLPLSGQEPEKQDSPSQGHERDQHQFDPASTQYMEGSAAQGGGLGAADAVGGQAPSYRVSDRPLGVVHGPGGNILNQSLPRSLHGDLAVLGAQQLQGDGSKEQKARTIAPPEGGQSTQAPREARSRPAQRAFVQNASSSLKDDEQNRSSNFQRHTDFHLTQSGNEEAELTMQAAAESGENTNTAGDTTLQHQQFQNQQVVQNLNVRLHSRRPAGSRRLAQADQRRSSQQVSDEQKQEIEQLILSHIMQSITSQENIQVILNSKNSNQLIYAKDANYMNQAVFNKFAKTWAEREGVRTNAEEVLKECRERIHHLYLEVAAYFGMSSQRQAAADGRRFSEGLAQEYVNQAGRTGAFLGPGQGAQGLTQPPVPADASGGAQPVADYPPAGQLQYDESPPQRPPPNETLGSRQQLQENSQSVAGRNPSRQKESKQASEDQSRHHRISVRASNSRATLRLQGVSDGAGPQGTTPAGFGSGSMALPAGRGKNVRFLSKGSLDLHEPRPSSQDSAAGGFARKRTPSLDKKLDFNVQIKYKNADNEVNIKSPQSSEAARRNSHRVDAAPPLSPHLRDLPGVEPQQFPRKLRTPIYPESLNRGGRTRQQAGTAEQAQRYGRAAARSGQHGGPPTTAPATRPTAQSLAGAGSSGYRMAHGRPRPPRRAPPVPGAPLQVGQVGASQRLSGQQPLGATMPRSNAGGPSLLEQPPVARAQRPGPGAEEAEGISFVVVGGRVQRRLPPHSGVSRSGATRLGESATTRISAAGVADLSRRPPQFQSASQPAFKNRSQARPHTGSQNPAHSYAMMEPAKLRASGGALAAPLLPTVEPSLHLEPPFSGAATGGALRSHER